MFTVIMRDDENFRVVVINRFNNFQEALDYSNEMTRLEDINSSRHYYVVG